MCFYWRQPGRILEQNRFHRKFCGYPEQRPWSVSPCLAFIKEAGAEETVLWFFLNAWGPYLAGVLPGAALLALSWLGCGIGAGDGFFFLVSGLLLGLRHNLLFLCGTVLCCGLFGLGYYVWSRLKGNDAGGKTELPLLPFGVIPGIWTAVLYMTEFRAFGV